MRRLLRVTSHATRRSRTTAITGSKIKGNHFAVLLLLVLLPSRGTLAQRPAEPDPELTLAEFRALLPAQADGQSGESTRADERFFELLAAQGREAAARQSLDRLSGWTRAAETRLAAQSAPLIEVEMLRLAESRAEIRLERFEAERRRAVAAANRLLNRAADSALIAVTAGTSRSEPENIPSSPKPSAVASQAARFEQQLLPQAHDLIAKMYQNYLFGGVPLGTLLWQEEQVHQAELEYRLLLAEVERARSAGD
jgi:hypothetical protein